MPRTKSRFKAPYAASRKLQRLTGRANRATKRLRAQYPDMKQRTTSNRQRVLTAMAKQKVKEGVAMIHRAMGQDSAITGCRCGKAGGRCGYGR